MAYAQSIKSEFDDEMSSRENKKPQISRIINISFHDVENIFKTPNKKEGFFITILVILTEMVF